MIESPLVSVIISTHNRKEMLSRLITSLFQSTYPKEKIEAIVVDDASTDGTYKYITRQFPEVKIVRNSREKWVSASRNIGIKKATGNFIFLIDDDNVLDGRTLIEILKVMLKNIKIGIAAPIMYYYGDPCRIWCAGVRRNYITSMTTYLYRDQIVKELLPEILESEDFPNAFMVRRKVIEEIGLFDETNFPIHYEESDFCNRARQAGWKVVGVTRAKIWHDIPPQNQLNNFIGIWKEKRVYYTARNRILFHKKHSEVYQYTIFKIMFLPLFTIYYLLRILTSKSKRRKRLMIAYLRGVLNGLAVKGVVRR